MNPEYLCTLSGGYDSTAALLWSLERGATLALFVDYGQPYLAQEMAALNYLRGKMAGRLRWLGMQEVKVPLTVSHMPDDPWIPYRNLVLAAVATNWAVGLGCRQVVFGSKSRIYRPEDPISYLDSTQGFYLALETLVQNITEPHREAKTVRYQLPLVGWSKRQVLDTLHSKDIDLRRLWNCYRTDGVPEPCGACPHCQETQPVLEAVLTGASV